MKNKSGEIKYYSLLSIKVEEALTEWMVESTHVTFPNDALVADEVTFYLEGEPNVANFR